MNGISEDFYKGVENINVILSRTLLKTVDLSEKCVQYIKALKNICIKNVVESQEAAQMPTIIQNEKVLSIDSHEENVSQQKNLDDMSEKRTFNNTLVQYNSFDLSNQCENKNIYFDMPVLNLSEQSRIEEEGEEHISYMKLSQFELK